ncbi:MAG: hypothetical protein QOD75_3345 [Blastocatellia bacterium]|jgi:hypothetical protein|nr:hypothetical protein [Blastocatellia bacterium]
MKTKLSMPLLFLLTCVACGSQAQNYKSYKLPSGKEIKVNGIGKMDFPNSDPALVMNYLTDISIDDKVALRKEADEIWSGFQKDVENAKLKAGVIRATHVEGSGFVKSGKGYGFVFVKRDDEKWHCLDDDKKTKQ